VISASAVDKFARAPLPTINATMGELTQPTALSKKKGVLHRRDGEELPAPQGGESSGACSFVEAAFAASPSLID